MVCLLYIHYSLIKPEFYWHYHLPVRLLASSRHRFHTPYRLEEGRSLWGNLDVFHLAALVSATAPKTTGASANRTQFLGQPGAHEPVE